MVAGFERQQSKSDLGINCHFLTRLLKWSDININIWHDWERKGLAFPGEESQHLCWTHPDFWQEWSNCSSWTEQETILPQSKSCLVQEVPSLQSDKEQVVRKKKCQGWKINSKKQTKLILPFYSCCVSKARKGQEFRRVWFRSVLLIKQFGFPWSIY